MRLTRVSRDDLTVTRQPKGMGFSYRDADGALVKDAAMRKRIEALCIPPAWHAVRIAPNERAHIQALGVDEAGRDQYIYHPDWELRREAKKQRRVASLISVLPRLRRGVAQGLRAETGSRELALAIAVALIDRTAMRVGREKYLVRNGTRGAGTLFARDVCVAGKEIRMTFEAKGDKRTQYCVVDERLADAVRRIKSLSGKRLLVCRSDAGKIRPVETAAINTYLRELAGVEISAKDFRTLHASALAGEALAKLDAGGSQNQRRRQMAHVARQVADILRNTPAVSRKAYILPCLFRLFDDGLLKAVWEAAGPGRARLSAREKRLGVVLATAGKVPASNGTFVVPV
jgi:DNA topoisomerase-1